MLVAIAVFQTRLTSVVAAVTTGADIFKTENAFSCVGTIADDFSRLNLSFDVQADENCMAFWVWANEKACSLLLIV